MEAIFFISAPSEAKRVRSELDLGLDLAGEQAGEQAGEPVRIASPAALRALASALGLDRKTSVAPLTDATCQSFPIWVFSGAFSRCLRELGDEALERAAEAWLADDSMADGDCDLHELSSLIEELRRSVSDSVQVEARVCALIEEKAF